MLEELKEKWDYILKVMKEEFSITDISFKMWILPLEVYSVEDDVVTIVSPEKTTGITIVNKKYSQMLKATISEIMNHEYEISIYSVSEIDNIQKESSKKQNSTYNNKNSIFNPKYTFDTFVVGDSNNMAYSASLAVAETPGESYNPLFIYGGPGLGKTHLMHAICNFIVADNPSLNIKYVTSEDFTNELIESIHKKTNKEFREKYRNVDVLLIDDIQFIVGRDATQEEFFHTFNTLRDANKQIIITSDRPPQDFDTLEARLKSRFEWGLTVDIKPPIYETRMAILQKKAELEGYTIDNEILDYIATNIKSNIRELEGSLTKLVAFSKLTHNEITLKFAEESLKDIISPNAQRKITPELIIQIVADHYGITTEDIISSRRSNDIAYPRQIAMYLCRYMTDVPYETIGNNMGKRDHSTIKYGVDKIAADLKKDQKLRETIDIITKKINPS